MTPGPRRAVLIGNSGSGKTWLAGELSARLQVPVIHLDELFWEPGGFDRKRSPERVAAMTEARLREPAWIVEGVFGSLAAPFLEHADVLVWLDLPWDICSARLRIRGSESKRHMCREQSTAGLARLLAWAERYDARAGDCSSAGHQALFEGFPRHAFRLQSPEEVNAFLATWPHSPAGPILLSSQTP